MIERSAKIYSQVTRKCRYDDKTDREYLLGHGKSPTFYPEVNRTPDSNVYENILAFLQDGHALDGPGHLYHFDEGDFLILKLTLVMGDQLMMSVTSETSIGTLPPNMSTCIRDELPHLARILADQYMYSYPRDQDGIDMEGLGKAVLHLANGQKVEAIKAVRLAVPSILLKEAQRAVNHRMSEGSWPQWEEYETKDDQDDTVDESTCGECVHYAPHEDPADKPVDSGRCVCRSSVHNMHTVMEENIQCVVFLRNWIDKKEE